MILKIISIILIGIIGIYIVGKIDDKINKKMEELDKEFRSITGEGLALDG